MLKLVIATILCVAIYYTNGSHYDIGKLLITEYENYVLGNQIIENMKWSIKSQIILAFFTGQESQIRLKRDNIESSIKGMSGLGEVDPGFIKIKPNKVLVGSDPDTKGK